jgi:uncharacterized protein (DUF305 family)
MKTRFRTIPLQIALLALLAVPGTPQLRDNSVDPNWAELMSSMERMHAAMAAASATHNPDTDFVNLMLPHHQAAIEMARAELAHGTDPQMRRLAQEIIVDQQSEIELMHLWSKQHPAVSPKLRSSENAH